MKAEIRLLRDTLFLIKNNAKDALNTEDIMFEYLNSNIENRSHLKHDGEDILYPGEDKKTKLVFSCKINPDLIKTFLTTFIFYCYLLLISFRRGQSSINA